MKKIFIIQVLNLKTGALSIASSCHSSESEALEHIDCMKRVYAQSDKVPLEVIEDRYLFNVVRLDTFNL